MKRTSSDLVPYVGSNDNFNAQPTDEQQTTDSKIIDATKTILNEQNIDNQEILQSKAADSIDTPGVSLPTEIIAKILCHAGFRVGISKRMDTYLRNFDSVLKIEKLNEERLGLGGIHPCLFEVMENISRNKQDVNKLQEELASIVKTIVQKYQELVAIRTVFDQQNNQVDVQTLEKLDQIQHEIITLYQKLNHLMLDFSKETCDSFKLPAKQMCHFSLRGIKSSYLNEEMTSILAPELKLAFFNSFLHTFKKLESIDLFYSENNFFEILSSLGLNDLDNDYELSFLSILLQNNPNIKELAIAGTHFKDLTNPDYNSEKFTDLLKNLTKLKILKIGYEFRECSESLFKLSSLKNLEELFIDAGGSVSPTHLKTISQHLTGLKKMNLSMSVHTFELHRFMSSISKFPKLEELIIDIGPETIVHEELDTLLQSYTPPPSLKKLQLITCYKEGDSEMAQKHQELHDICSKFLPGTEITISPWIMD